MYLKESLWSCSSLHSKHQTCWLLSPCALPLKAFAILKRKMNDPDVKIQGRFWINNGRICAFHGNFFSHHLLSPCINWQKLTTLSPPPEPSDWSAVSINTDLYLGTIRSSVNNLINRFQEELKRLYGKGKTASLLWNNRTKSNLVLF